MNLTDMDDADAKRLVDFAAGLIFGLHGSIERVTSKVFLLSPENVEVTAEDRPDRRPGGLLQPELTGSRCCDLQLSSVTTPCHERRSRDPRLRRLPLLHRAHRPVRLRLDPDVRREWRPRGVALLVAEPVYTLTDPPLRALRKVIPPLRLGGVRLDLSFMVLFFFIYILLIVL